MGSKSDALRVQELKTPPCKKKRGGLSKAVLLVLLLLAMVPVLGQLAQLDPRAGCLPQQSETLQSRPYSGQSLGPLRQRQGQGLWQWAEQQSMGNDFRTTSRRRAVMQVLLGNVTEWGE